MIRNVFLIVPNGTECDPNCTPNITKDLNEEFGKPDKYHYFFGDMIAKPNILETMIRSCNKPDNESYLALGLEDATIYVTPEGMPLVLETLQKVTDLTATSWDILSAEISANLEEDE